MKKIKRLRISEILWTVDEGEVMVMVNEIASNKLNTSCTTYPSQKMLYPTPPRSQRRFLSKKKAHEVGRVVRQGISGCSSLLTCSNVNEAGLFGGV
jgi:hypothetical protein